MWKLNRYWHVARLKITSNYCCILLKSFVTVLKLSCKEHKTCPGVEHITEDMSRCKTHHMQVTSYAILYAAIKYQLAL